MSKKREHELIILAAVLLVLYLLFHKPAPVENVTSSVSFGAPSSGTLTAAPTAPLSPVASSAVISDGSVSTIEVSAIDPVTGRLTPLAGTF